MGSRPILPVKVTITIDTKWKNIGPNFGDGFVVGPCEQGFNPFKDDHTEEAGIWCRIFRLRFILMIGSVVLHHIRLTKSD